MPEQTQKEELAKEPNGDVRRWQMELAASRTWMEKWHKRGEKVLCRFRDERESDQMQDTRWPYFAANVQTQRALLYGQVPAVDVVRRFADATDDVARVASEILERMLNADIESDGDTYADALGYALSDRMLPGMGLVRVRYEVEIGEVQPAREPMLNPDGTERAPAVPAVEGKLSEDVETDYVHWKDVLWSPARVFHEVRWIAFRAEMSREEMLKRFGDVAKLVPLNSKSSQRDADKGEAKAAHPWDRAEVWEIWSKEDRKVYWYVEGFAQLLDTKDDPLGLEGFWPCPKPMLANVTTSNMLPVPDFVLAQDIYDEIDTVSTRITLLERAVRVAGVYDKTNSGVKRLVGEAAQNELIPVDNWGMFAEKGGVKGAIDWLPLDQIVNALAVLRDYRRELVDSLYQVTGMSDIMRGQATQAATTATEQRIKAQYGSVRMQALQDEFACFASDVQKLKAEIIAKHFDPATIIKRANVQFMSREDQQLVQQAVQLIKSGGSAFRVEVKPEAVSMADFNAQRQESTEVLQSIAGFMSAAAPLAQQSPAMTPYLLQMLQWVVSRVRGASTLEGMLDQAIATAQQQAQQAQANPQQAAPDPKVVAQQMKGQQDLAKVEAEKRADIEREAFKVQADAQREENQALWNTREAAMKQQIANAAKPQMPMPAQGRPTR